MDKEALVVSLRPSKGGVKTFFEVIFPRLFYVVPHWVFKSLKWVNARFIYYNSSDFFLFYAFFSLFSDDHMYIVHGNELLWNKELKKNKLYQYLSFYFLKRALIKISKKGQLYSVSKHNIRFYEIIFKKKFNFRLISNYFGSFNFNRFNKKSDKIRVLIIGGVEKVKCLEEFYSFAKDCNVLTYEFVFVGNKKIVSTASITSYPILESFALKNEMIKSHFIVINSRFEGYPMVVAEAENCGVVVFVRNRVMNTFSTNSFLYFNNFHELLEKMVATKALISKSNFYKYSHVYDGFNE